MKHHTAFVPMTRRTRAIALFFILIITTALWSGVGRIRLNGDDYQYIASLAPIQHIGDVLRPFVSPDFNRNFFRPVANMTMALDFLFFGWSGAAFHLTNLFFHLVATTLVFYFVRDIFLLTEKESLWAALIFGFIASHEYNLVVDTARADVLAAMFVMLALLLQKRGNHIFAVTSFLLALLSKEIAIMALPLLCWEKFMGEHRSVGRSAAIAAPYITIAALFYFYHAHFTQPMFENDPLGSNGAHSIVSFFQNGIYSIGYLIFPLDLDSAVLVLSRYRALSLLSGTTLFLALLWIVIRERDKAVYLKPMIFTVLTGIVLFPQFERWRLYLPSVGVIAIAVIVVSRTSSRMLRAAFLVAIVPLGAFHLYRALDAESEWRTSTALRDRLKENLTGILSTIPERPVTIGMIASPSKLGSAAVMQLGLSALVTRAEADRISQRNRETGTTDSARVDSWCAVNVYALNSSEGFRDLEMTRIGDKRFLVSASKGGNIILYPATLTGNVIARNRAMAVGDSVVTPEFVDIVQSVERGMVKSIEVRVRGTTAALLSFNHANEFERIR
jgi:hypothetical protein